MTNTASKTKRGTPLKMYRHYGAARKAAGERPVIKVGLKCYLVGDFDGLDSVEVITGGGQISATVILSHLERLGNANHATPGRPHDCPKAFYREPKKEA